MAIRSDLLDITQDVSEVANAAIEHLGGYHNLTEAIQARDFFHTHEGNGGVSFRFSGGSKVNYAKVVETAPNTYTLTLYKAGKRFSKVSETPGVQGGQLLRLFESEGFKGRELF